MVLYDNGFLYVGYAKTQCLCYLFVIVDHSKVLRLGSYWSVLHSVNRNI